MIGTPMTDFGKNTYQKLFDVKGKWWIVGKSRDKVSGTLHVNAAESNIDLELYDLLPRWLYPGHGTPYRQTIFGESDDGQLISLHNCYTRRSSGHRVTYYVGIVFANAHIRKLSSVRFESMFVSLTNLEQWIKTEPIRTEVVNN